MNSIQYYQVAGHIFRLQLPTESPLWKKLDNYAPFSIENPENVEPIFTLQITEAPTSYEPETNKCIGEFDCDAAYLKLFETTDGGRMFFISQGSKEKAYHLYTTTDYRSASLYFPANGNESLHVFAINNAMMLLYAFATATRNTLLIHASVIVNARKGYVFLGRSGTGKSTHSRLWLNHVAGSSLLNDDNPVIRIIGKAAYVYGSPWSGKTPCYKNEEASLGGIVRLSQAPRNEITHLKGVTAYAAITPSVSAMRWERQMADGIHATLAALTACTDIYHLECLPDKAAACLCSDTVRKERTCNA